VQELIRVARFLWRVDSWVLVLLLIRLGYLGFFQRYPAMMAYLAVDLIGSVVGLRYGTGSLTYYWSYFLSNILAGSVLLIWMSREMFAELYWNHPGLVGVTQFTLKRSILIGSAVTLSLAPVGIIHWGDAGFKCWEFFFFEVHRCLAFGVVVFVIAMWRKLRLIPLCIPRNVKTYAFSTCVYLTLGGLGETVDLIIHTHVAARICGAFLLTVSLMFYALLGSFAERPTEVKPVSVSLGAEEFAWLYSMSGLFARVDEAHRRGRASTLRRICSLAPLGSICRGWRACTRAAYVILGLAQKE
jgi:hypothetical protein